MKLCALFFTLNLLFSFVTFAQEENRCLPTTSPEQKKKHSHFFDYQETFNQEVKKNSQSESFARTEADLITIPIIVHVIHRGEPVGTGTNISAAQIQTQIDVLNEDFSNNNPYKSRTVADFRDLADDTGIRFALADLDPDGKLLPEKGIRRIRSPFIGRIWDDVSFDRDMKPTTIWDPSKYLNIWVIDTLRLGGDVLAGYSSFPDLTGLQGLPSTGDLSKTDGIVLRYSRIGSAGKIRVPQLPIGRFTFGRTGTHEIGHFLGLLHPFEANSCSIDGDYCSDTPIVSNNASGCNLSFSSCSRLSMVQNYMEFSNDSCMTLFTKDQIRRMRTTLQVSPRRIALTQSKVVSFIDRVLSSKISVYPNPAQTQIRIVAPDILVKNYQIYNTNGQQIAYKRYDELSENIDVSALDVGLYLLQIETNRGVAVKKIVIQR
jgi:hypothetical protein